jgi:hypothetical protein
MLETPTPTLMIVGTSCAAGTGVEPGPGAFNAADWLAQPQTGVFGPGATLWSQT